MLKQSISKHNPRIDIFTSLESLISKSLMFYSIVSDSDPVVAFVYYYYRSIFHSFVLNFGEYCTLFSI